MSHVELITTTKTTTTTIYPNFGIGYMPLVELNRKEKKVHIVDSFFVVASQQAMTLSE